MLSDLADSSAAGLPLESLSFGGAPPPDVLVPRAQAAFPKAAMYVSSSFQRHTVLKLFAALKATE